MIEMIKVRDGGAYEEIEGKVLSERRGGKMREGRG